MKYIYNYYIVLVLLGMIGANLSFAFFYTKDYSSAVERSYFQAFLVGVVMFAPKDACVEITDEVK